MIFVMGLLIGIGLSAILVGLNWKRLRREDMFQRMTADRDRAQSDLEEYIEYARKLKTLLETHIATTRRNDQAQANLMRAEARITELEDQLKALRKWVDQHYGHAEKLLAKDHRPDFIWELYHQEGWSKRRIMNHLWGYVNGTILKNVNAVLQDTAVD